MNQRVIVRDAIRSQDLDRPHVSEVSELHRDPEIVIARNPADREEPVARHVQNRDKVADLHVVIPWAVSHPPVPIDLILNIRRCIAVRPKNSETAEILTVVPSPSLAESSLVQFVKQEPPLLLGIPARAHGPTVHHHLLHLFEFVPMRRCASKLVPDKHPRPIGHEILTRRLDHASLTFCRA